jgi:hypothetical protein
MPKYSRISQLFMQEVKSVQIEQSKEHEDGIKADTPTSGNQIPALLLKNYNAKKKILKLVLTLTSTN